jgi:hypothetical protein
LFACPVGKTEKGQLSIIGEVKVIFHCLRLITLYLDKLSMTETMLRL